MSAELHNSAFRGDLERVKQLLQAGVDVNACNGYGHTAVMYAAKNGHAHVVELLVRSHGADTSIKDQFGNTALSFAIASNNHKVVAILTDTDKEPEKPSKDRKHPSLVDPELIASLCGAVDSNNVQALQALTKHPHATININSFDKLGYSVAMRAAEKGHLDCLRWLVDQSAAYPDISSPLSGRVTCLMLAADNDHLECVLWLMNQGRAHVDLKDEKGRSARYHALAAGNMRCVFGLLTRDPSLNTLEADITDVTDAIVASSSDPLSDDDGDDDSKSKHRFVALSEKPLGVWLNRAMLYFTVADKEPSEWTKPETMVLSQMLTIARGFISVELLHIKASANSTRLLSEFDSEMRHHSQIFQSVRTAIKKHRDFEPFEKRALEIASLAAKSSGALKQHHGSIQRLYQDSARLKPSMQRMLKEVSKRVAGCEVGSVKLMPLFTALQLVAFGSDLEEGEWNTEILTEILEGTLQAPDMSQLLVVLEVLVGMCRNIEGGYANKNSECDIVIRHVVNRFSTEQIGWGDCTFFISFPRVTGSAEVVAKLTVTLAAFEETSRLANVNREKFRELKNVLTLCGHDVAPVDQPPSLALSMALAVGVEEEHTRRMDDGEQHRDLWKALDAHLQQQSREWSGRWDRLREREDEVARRESELESRISEVEAKEVSRESRLLVMDRMLAAARETEAALLTRLEILETRENAREGRLSQLELKLNEFENLWGATKGQFENTTIM
eukprot:c20374_g1_i1.p1 GENE.c20374_g1_i1~~c20374_g1_i1.p1  ORF type:complete len:730 (-),score=188.64 c20374_g1_i1:168-2357(-)